MGDTWYRSSVPTTFGRDWDSVLFQLQNPYPTGSYMILTPRTHAKTILQDPTWFLHHGRILSGSPLWLMMAVWRSSGRSAQFLERGLILLCYIELIILSDVVYFILNYGWNSFQRRPSGKAASSDCYLCHDVLFSCEKLVYIVNWLFVLNEKIRLLNCKPASSTYTGELTYKELLYCESPRHCVLSSSLLSSWKSETHCETVNII